MTINPPKPAWNFAIQLFFAAPFVLLGAILVSSEFAPDFKTKLHAFVLLCVFYAITLVASYSVAPSRRAVISDWQYLQIYKKDNLIAEYKLVDIKEIVSKTIKRNLERPQYEVAIQINSGDYDVLFKTELIYSRRQWDLFSEQLSSTLEKPLRIEFWREDYDGKLALIPLNQRIAVEKKIKITLLIPLAISFAGALCFKLDPNSKTFLIAGLATILVNLCVYFLFASKDRQKEKVMNNNSITIAGILFSMIVPYATQYLFFVFALTGFDIRALARLIN